MANLSVVFLTGLTTGGLSCLAVQGGLLASSVATQAEEDILKDLAVKPGDKSRGPEYLQALEEISQQGFSTKQHKKALQKLKHKYPKVVETEMQESKKHVAQPIALFLGSKIVAYTILGALLGALGSTLQLTPYMRAGLQIAIGIFMAGTALRMFNVHPIFRYFSIEPPKSVTRYIRRKAKNSDGQFVTPIFLGALTVLIPCGITTAMMALAIGTGSPLQGALILAAFTIGTSPVFFSLAYFATKLGEKMQSKFLKVAGVVVLALGLVSIEGGLNLAGSPVSFANLRQALASPPDTSQQQTATNQPSTRQSSTAPPPSQAPPAADAQSTASPQFEVLNMSATSQSYSPSVIQAKAGQPYKLVVNSQNNTGCGRGLTIPALGMQTTLPENGTKSIDIPAQKPGTLRLTCVMGMYNAQIKFI